MKSDAAFRFVLAALIVFCLTLGTAHAGDDRPIVYAARYYSPPLRPRVSTYSHLYRIRPDGTSRTRVTSAHADDTLPRWSPDGRHIAFRRDPYGNDCHWSICVVGSDGVQERVLYHSRGEQDGYWPKFAWKPDSRAVLLTLDKRVLRIDVRTGRSTSSPLPKTPTAATIQVRSPDGKRVCSIAPDGHAVIRAATGQSVVPVKVGLREVVWRDNNSLLGLPADGAPGFWLLGVDGVPMPAPLYLVRKGEDTPREEEFGGVRHAYPDGPLLYPLILGDSTHGHWFLFYRLNPHVPTLELYEEGDHLVWSPGYTRYVTSRGRTLAAYGRWPDARGKRTVWVSQLFVGRQGKPQDTHPIVSGLVSVQGADWRGGGRMDFF